MIEVIIEKSRASKLYQLVEGSEKPSGLAPQAQFVFYAMAMLDRPATPEEIGSKCEEIAGWKSKQPSARIVQYYIPTLNKLGLIIKQ